MALYRNPLSRAVQTGGAIATVALTAMVWVFLSGDLNWPLPYKLGAFALLCFLVIWIALSWLERSIILPLDAVTAITLRVAEGDLGVSGEEIRRVGGGAVTDGINRMVRELNRLVGAIRASASDREISAVSE